MKRSTLQAASLVVATLVSTTGHGQSNIASGFDRLADGTKIVLMRPSVAILQIDASGKITPQPDWSRDAAGHVRQSMLARNGRSRVQIVELAGDDEAAFSDLRRIQGAVSAAIAYHHFGDSKERLKSKRGQLDWSVGPASAESLQKTGATYAVFIDVGDLRPTEGREAIAAAASAAAGLQMILAIVSLNPGLAPRGPVPSSGSQQYARAMLVELKSGRVLWASLPLPPSSYGGTYDFRQRNDVDDAMKVLFDGFPAP